MQKISFFRKLFLGFLVCVATSGVSFAQETDAMSTFTPYSLFGIGDLEKQGTAYNKAMGGIGVGVRDNRFINYLNPASITARDTLSFMLDFGASSKNFYNKDTKGVSSAYNTFNMNNFIFTAPIYKKSALIVGVTPYSNIGYKFKSREQDPNIILNYGDVSYLKYGIGSVNQLFVGAAMNFLKDFSIGAEMIYYFGNLERHSDLLYTTNGTTSTVATGWDYSLGAIGGRVGLQYFKELGKDKELTVGATYRFGVDLKGDLTRYSHSVIDADIDTIYSSVKKDYIQRIPGEFAAGVSFKKKDKWMIGFDYKRQDWKSSSLSEISEVGYSPATASSFRVGFEFIPNKYDIRYYLKRVTYRVGAYYDKTYIDMYGNQVNAMGITIGSSFPIYRLYNSLNWALDFGKRGSLKDGMVREMYFQVHINVSLHDIWFVKKKYQ